MTNQLSVFVDMQGRDVEVGTGYFTRRRRTLATSFQYAQTYLRHENSYPIDPALGLFSGQQHTAGLPGAFADCAPDRWGKNLITKKFQVLALREARQAASISEVDFLIGVSDLTRQGALRFRKNTHDPFLASDLPVPPMVELPRLLQAADAVARDGTNEMSAIKALLDAGSASLGGARPKASVRDNNRLLIAKFPHHNDDWNVLAWEKTALDLAKEAGIDTPGYELVKIDGRSVLVLERFDREQERRIGYISAMTLIGSRDGDVRDYTEIAETLPEHGSRISDDLRELWRRIAFSVTIHNTDDHLRNHGFLRDGTAGWRLSPVFDVNPNPNVAEERVTGIGGARARTAELAGLMTYVGLFDLSDSDAKQVLREVADATADWRRVASSNGIDTSEQNRFNGAFDGLRGAIAELISGFTAPASRQPRIRGGRKGGGRFASRSEHSPPSGR